MTTDTDLLIDAADPQLADELAAPDLTAVEAADYLAEELPGVELHLSESVTAARGPGYDAECNARLLTARVGPWPASRLFTGATWRAVAADIIAAVKE